MLRHLTITVLTCPLSVCLSVADLSPLVLGLFTSIRTAGVATLSPGGGLGWYLVRKCHQQNILHTICVVSNPSRTQQVNTIIPASVIVLIPASMYSPNTRALQAVSPKEYFVLEWGIAPKLVQGIICQGD